MAEIFDGIQAKEIDRISIKEMGMPSLVLMERASLCVAKAVAKNASREETVLAVCGSGNNGGDGVAAARILAEWGYSVTILLLGKEERFSEELTIQLNIARNLKLHIVKEANVRDYSIILDGIFGIGLDREIAGSYRDWIQQINSAGAKVFAIDIPSGIHATTGKVLGTAVQADITVTFGVGKLGLFLFPGRTYGGRVLIEDIGFPGEAKKQVHSSFVTYEKKDLEELFPKRIPQSNKGSYGKLLVIAGSENMGGAALFAARAGYLMGAGLVKVVTHQNNRGMIQEGLPEALIGVYDNETYDLTQDIAWATGVVIGPGLGQTKQGKGLLEQVLKIRDIPVLIDADGLNILAELPEYFDEERRLLLQNNFLVTPHLKEMSRLRRCDVKTIQENTVNSVKNYTRGAVIVQKDAVTLVSDGKEVYVNSSGNHALAKGGSGDVLSGMIGGLLARGVTPFRAGCLGVYLHGLTAEEYVKHRSSSSMLATDILDMLPLVLP